MIRERVVPPTPGGADAASAEVGHGLEPPLARLGASELCALWRKNRERLADDHRERRAVSLGRPAHMKIELTNFCNLACPMCPHQQMRREVGYMKEALFHKIIDEALPELEFAYLHHLGESLFHGRIGAMIRYGRAKGVAMGLSTNATFLTQRKAHQLLQSGLDFLVISLDGASPDTYRRMRVGGDFQATVGNVRRFFEVKRALRAQTTVVVQLIVTESNRHEIEPFSRMWDGQVMIKVVRDWAGQVRLGPGHAPPPIARVPCRVLWTELTVLWDGLVVPCANVYERQNVLGDLRTQSVAEVWNGPELMALRLAHLQERVGQVPVCATCPRHPFEYEGFVAVDQLTARLRHYTGGSLSPRPGLS